MPTHSLPQIRTAKQRSDDLWRDGYVVLRKVAAQADLAEYRSSIIEAVRRFSDEERPLADRNTYDKAFLQIPNLWQRDEAVKRFVFEDKFAQAAADLLGVEKVRLYHDQALFKEPGGGHTPWHQDKYYWPLDTEKMITMWMPLVDIDEKMGMIAFASGSHVSRPVDSREISDESEQSFSRYIADHDFDVFRPDSMQAGDATFHLGWTIHGAGPNGSDQMREAMTIIYFADGARVTEPESPSQQADLDAWLGGRRPGQLADSMLNPIMN